MIRIGNGEFERLKVKLNGTGHGHSFTCKCPAHDDQNPSLSITLQGDRLVMKCFAGCETRTVLEKLTLGSVPKSGDPSNSSKSTQRRLIELWSSCQDLSATATIENIANLYLRNRGLHLPEIPGALRFHPSLQYWRDKKIVGEFPALVAKIVNREGNLIALQRIYLQPNGTKIENCEAKKIYGKYSGGCTWLGKPKDQVAVVEGLETGLAVWLSTKLPVCVAHSASNIPKQTFPDEVIAIHIYADCDQNQVGERYATALAEKLWQSGRTVKIHIPEPLDKEGGLDWLDVYVAKGAAPLLAKTAVADEYKPEIRELVCLADVEAEKVDFLFYPYMPLGKLTLIEGDPGLGKSWITLALAAAVSVGNDLSGKQTRAAADVVIFNAEDGVADTLKLRLEKVAESQGCDLRRISAFSGYVVFDEDGIACLERVLLVKRPKLTIIDPLVAFLGSKTDMNRANEVRAFMTRLGALAARFHCSIVCVRHLSKDAKNKAVYRGQGSIDFTAVARSVLLVACDPENKDIRGLIHIKSNLAEQGRSIGYRVDAEGFRWTGESQLTEQSIMSSASSFEPSEIDVAEEILRELLNGKPALVSEIYRLAEEHEVSERTMQRAKRNLGIKSRPEGETGKKGVAGWSWFFPDSSAPDLHRHGQVPGGGSLNSAPEEASLE